MMFKYITTTEFAMSQCLELVREIKTGEKDSDKSIDVTANNNEIVTEFRNVLLDIGKSENRKDFSLFKSKQGKSKDKVLKVLTGSLLKTKRESWNVNLRNYTANSNDSEEDNEGGSESEIINNSEESEDEGEDEEDEVELEEDKSEISLDNENKDKLQVIQNKVEKKITKVLKMKENEPIDSLETICASLVDYSKSFDLQLQEKISEEINKGKVEIKGKEYIKDSKIFNRTNFDQRPTSARRKTEENVENNDLPQDREYIAFGHERFDLVFNIMLGIKRSIDCIFHSPFSQIRKSDYKAQYKYKNEWYSANEDSANYFIFIDYAPKVFEDIRIKDGVSNESYIEALGPNNIYNYIWTNDFKTFTSLVSSGKSGSLFYYTQNGKFMLKTIAKDEFNKLLATLQDYHLHLVNFPDSLLNRFYGLHKIKYQEKGSVKEQYIIIMNNMFRNFQPDIKYDLKGSSIGRTTEFKDGKVDKKIALKDNNFKEKHQKVLLEPQDHEGILKCCKRDSEFLGRNTTLDYSLLLGIIYLEDVKRKLKENPESFNENDPVVKVIKEGKLETKERGIYLSSDKKELYVIGVIDTLTNYTTKKKLEYYYKRCKDGHQMSCIPPPLYAERFYDFMEETIFEQ